MAEEEGKSIGWVIGMLMLVVAFFGWGFAAGDYFQNTPGLGSRTNFFVNAVEQLPNARSVVAYTLQNRLWLVGLVFGVEAAILGFGLVMKRVERELNDPKGRRR